MLSQKFCNSVLLTKVSKDHKLTKCLNDLMLAEINYNKKNLKVFVNELSSLKSNLLRILSFLDFNHVYDTIISKKEKSTLKSKYTHRKKLSDLTPGYEVNPTRFSHDPNKVSFNFSLCLNRRRKRFAL